MAEAAEGLLKKYWDAGAGRPMLRRQVIDGLMRERVDPETLSALNILSSESDAGDLRTVEVHARVRSILSDADQDTHARIGCLNYLGHHTLVDQDHFTNLDTRHDLFLLLIDPREPTPLRREAGFALYLFNCGWLTQFVQGPQELRDGLQENRWAIPPSPDYPEAVARWRRIFEQDEDFRSRACAAILLAMADDGLAEVSTSAFLDAHRDELDPLGGGAGRLGRLVLDHQAAVLHRLARSIRDKEEPFLRARRSEVVIRPGRSMPAGSRLTSTRFRPFVSDRAAYAMVEQMDVAKVSEFEFDQPTRQLGGDYTRMGYISGTPFDLGVLARRLPDSGPPAASPRAAKRI